MQGLVEEVARNIASNIHGALLRGVLRAPGTDGVGAFSLAEGPERGAVREARSFNRRHFRYSTKNSGVKGLRLLRRVLQLLQIDGGYRATGRTASRRFGLSPEMQKPTECHRQQAER